jgi:dTDP-4-amino-4,6-dideoxygalactose transaminase
MGEQQNCMRTYPRLPVLGWPAFSGGRAARARGVLSAAHRRYTASGRAAIALALRVLGAGPGDRIFVPTYHCPTMIAPVVRAGAQPVFYPITSSGAPDLDWLQRTGTAGARALLAAHFFGIPQPMSALRAFCDQSRIALIEDCAHAFFGSAEGVPVGSWGDLAIASLPKFFPVPEGGVLASATRALADAPLQPVRWRAEAGALLDAVEIGAEHRRFPGLNALLGAAFTVKTRLRRRLARPPARGGPVAPREPTAMDTRLDSLAQTVTARWISTCVRESRIVERRRRNYAALSSRLARLRGARVLRPDLPEEAAPYVLPLYVDDPAASYQRLREAGVPLFRWDEVWPGTPVLAGDHGLDWAVRVFQLACHQDLSPEDIDDIAATVCRIVAP